ncbi:MAG: ABC transporter ATP-binding protein [Sinobacterium sp.]|nr:ABC transporter ATP-binding protein [Sinobacterium sp.]
MAINNSTGSHFFNRFSNKKSEGKTTPENEANSDYVLGLPASGKVYIFASSIAATLASLVLPFSIMIFFDRIIPNNSFESLAFIFVIILLSIAVDNILKSLESQYIDKYSEREGQRLVGSLYQLLLNASLEQYQKEKYGVYLEDINTIESAKSTLLTEKIKQIANIAATSMVWIVICLIHPVTGAILFIGGLLAFLIGHLSRYKQFYLSAKKSALEGSTNTTIIEIISSTHAMKCANMEFRIENHLNPMMKQREMVTSCYEENATKINARTALLNQVLLFIVVFSCATAVINNDINQGVMAAVILLVNRYNQQLQTVISAHHMRVLTDSARKSLAHLQALKPNNEGKALITAVETIEFIHAGSQEIKMGAVCAIQGSSGAGKTLCLSALSKLAKSTQPFVLINGIDINVINSEQWQEMTVLINNESQFIEGNIIDNLTCYNKQLHNTAYYLCKLFKIKNTIDSLEKGFYTHLQKKGRLPFSNKIKYILTLIRGLICQKPIMLLDDIDSVLTAKETRQIYEILHSMRRNNFTFAVSNTRCAEDFFTAIDIEDWKVSTYFSLNNSAASKES